MALTENGVVEKAINAEHPGGVNCKYWGTCGGCDINPQTSFPYKIEDKVALLREHLRELSLPKINLIKAESQVNQRRRVLLRVHTKERTEVGFFRHGSRELLTIDDCLQLRPELQVLLKALADFKCSRCAHIRVQADSFVTQGTAHLAVRTHVVRNPHVQHQQVERDLKDYLQHSLKSPLVFVDEHSDPLYCEEDELYFAPGGFRQNNAAINRVLRDYICKVVQHEEISSILDLGCGNGNLSLNFSDAALIDFVDAEPRNIAALLANIEKYDTKTSQISKLGFAEFFARKQPSLRSNYDLLIANPPRSGFVGSAKHIADLAAKNIVYVSCNAMSLAKDLEVILANGYFVKHISVFDMFPMTKHWETLVYLQRL